MVKTKGGKERKRKEVRDRDSYLDVLLQKCFLAGPSKSCSQVSRGYRGICTLRGGAWIGVV
jgi:hypothetical protein